MRNVDRLRLQLCRRLGRSAIAIVAAIATVLLVQAPALAKDSDKDGIPDRWEKRGKTPQGLNLKKLGAKWKHKDLFIELAYSTKSGPDKISCAALDALYDAWRGAPLTNPSGRTGVRLHLDADKTCPSRSYDLNGVSRFTASTPCASPLDSANAVAQKRLRIFHLGAVVDDSELCGVEGQATTSDFLVKDQAGSTFFSYVVMHELGHMFGLDHGPFNGFSVMSGGAYEFGTGGANVNVDFLRYPVQALNEAALDENVGYQSTSAAGNTWLSRWYGPQFCNGSLRLIGRATGPLDWNCSGAEFWMPPYSQWIDPGTVSYDVNGDGSIGIVPAVPDEWSRVNLKVGRLNP